LHGVFPEILRAYAVVGSKLFLWKYDGELYVFLFFNFFSHVYLNGMFLGMIYMFGIRKILKKLMQLNYLFPK
jgi:hypothetical protein